ncbi:MAG: metal-dependent transcriptional regulator [Acidobacteriota bacterium]
MKFGNPFSRRSRPTHHPETGEMILLSLVRADENAQVAFPNDLARELELSRATLDSHVGALVAAGLVTNASGGMLALSPSGRHRAHALLRRHRLAERLFTDVLGMDWAHAHAEADKFEHMVSAEAEAALATRLGDPETCPHGNPIPGAGQASMHSLARPLAECAPVTRAIIARIGLETPAALQHLATLGLLPDVEIQVENKVPMGGPVMVRVGRAHYALGRDLASRIWVTPLA